MSHRGTKAQCHGLPARLAIDSSPGLGGPCVHGTCLRDDARKRALARPMAAGLLICAGLFPLSSNVLPTVAARSDEFSTKPTDLEPHARPLDEVSSPQDRIAPAIELAALPAPLIEQDTPRALTVAAAPRPPTFVTALDPEVLPVREEPGNEPAMHAQADQPVAAEEVVAFAITPALPATLAVAAVPAPLVQVTPPPAPTPGASSTAPLRRVDIAQVDASASGVHVPQLYEPGLAPGGPNLAEKTAAMQVVLPPPARLGEQQLALLQMDAPSELTVRLGREAVGKVAFRMSENRSIDVQLSGLLDVLADRFAPDDFARLRSAAAADSYVPLDSLRSIGVSLRYDPVYDELRISA